MPNHLPTNTSRFVSISEAAGLLGVSLDTIRRWDKSGVISSVRLDGKNRYFSLDEIERIQSNKKLSISEAAEHLKISVSTLRRLEKRGVITTSRNANGEREYDIAALNAYLTQTTPAKMQEITEEGGSDQQTAPGPVIGHANVLPPFQSFEQETIPAQPEVITPISPEVDLAPMSAPQEMPQQAALQMDQSASNKHQVDQIEEYKQQFTPQEPQAPSVEAAPVVQPVEQNVQFVDSDYEQIEKEERSVSVREELFRDHFVSAPQVSFSKQLPGVPEHKDTANHDDINSYQSGSFLSSLRSRFMLLGLGVLMVLSASTAIFGLTTLQSPVMVKQTASKPTNGAEVLAASTRSLYDIMAFNIKTLFRSDVVFEESITVGADSVFKGNVTLEDTNLDAGEGEVTASNLLYSIVAGSGVTVTGDPQNPTISATATGVSSFQGATGAVTLTAGSGVSISGTTITNSDTGSSQKIFGKVKVGSDTIEAGSNTDTLELAAGTGVTLSADTSNKKITINASGNASGWTDAGTDVYVTTTTDNVGIGTTTPTDKLTVAGNVGISGNIGIGGDSINDFTGNGLIVSSNQLLVNLLGSADGASGTTSSYSGLEFRSGALTMLQGCSDDQLLKWDDGLNLWVCSNDAGGATAVINIKEGVTTYTGNDTIEFTASDFSVSQAGSEVDITIDYANSGITRNNQSETISSSWTFSNATPFSISNTSAIIPIGDGGSLRFSDGTNTLLTLTDAGTTGNLAITGAFTGATNETINGIDISSGTVSDVDNLTINSGGDLTIGTIGLNDTGASNVTSGASLIGVYNTDLANAVGATTVQQTLDALDNAISGLSAGSSKWDIASGAITPKFSSTLDLLLGGTSTASAKFAFINVNNGTPVASISAGNAGATFITADGSIGTTARQSLNIGGGNSGNVIINGTAIVSSLGAGVVHSNAAGVLSVSAVTNAELQNSSITFAGDSGSGGISLGGTVNILGGTGLSSSFSGSTLTINGDDATTATKGIASFAAGNFSVSSGAVSIATAGVGATELAATTVGAGTYGDAGNGIGQFTVDADGRLTAASNRAVGLGSADVSGTLPVARGGTGVGTFGGTNTILYTTAADSLGAITTANNGVLVTDGSGVPSIGSTLPNAVQDNITRLGTITSGVWNGTIIGTQYGGTGQNWSAVAQGSIPYFSAAGTMNTLAPSTAGFILSTNGAGQNPSWIDASSVGTNYWNQLDGGSALTPKFASVADLLLGGTATASAKFAVLNINNGTPTASVSSGLNGNSLFVTALGNLATERMQSLTLGGSTTGNIILDSGNGAIRLQDAVSFASTLTIGGDTIGDFVGTGLTLNGTTLETTLGTDIDLASAEVTGILALANGGTGMNINPTSIADGQILIGNNGADGFSLATLTAGTGINISNSAGGITISQTGSGASKWTEANGGSTLFPNYASVADVLIGGTSTSSAKFGFLNVNNGTPTASVSSGLNGNNGIYLTANGTLATTNRLNLTLGGAETGAIVLNGFGAGVIQSNASGALSSAALNLAGGGSYVSGILPVGNGGTGVSSFGGTNTLLYTTAADTLASLATANNGVLVTDGSGVPSISSTLPTAVQGNITSLGTITSGVWNGTAIGTQYGGTGQNWSAVAQGSIPYFSAAGTMNTLAPSTAGFILSTNGAGQNPSWIDASSVGTNYWNQLDGGSALTPKYASVADLLLGGTSTTSAKFAVLNINNGTPTASVSSGLNGNNGIYLTATGTLATTNKLNLTLGGADTGSIVLNGFGAGAVQTNAAGVLSTGTLSVANGGTGATSFTQNGILYGNNAGALQITAAAADSVLITNGSNVPSLSQTLPSAVQGNITTLGTITTGVWNGTAIGSQYGGTGQNFASSTGVPSLSSGTWSVNATLSTALGGLGANVTAAGAGELLYSTGTTTYDSLAAGNAGYILQSNGAGAPTWVDPGTIPASNYWNQLDGGSVLLPRFASVADLLLGGTSTASAKFAFINNLTGTPTASIAGSTADNSLYLTGNGSIATTNRQTLSLGGGGTGDIDLLIGGGNNLRINGTAGATVVSAGCVTAVNGLVTGTASCQSGTEQWDLLAGALVPKQAATSDLLLGATATSSAKFAVLNITNGTPIASISATGTTDRPGISLSADGTIQSLNRGSLTIGGNTTGNIFLSNATFAQAGLTVPSGQSLTLAGLTGNNAVLYATNGTGVVTSATTNSDGLCLMSSSGTNNPTWSACPGSGSGASKWTDSGAVLYPNTIDRRLGIGTATAGDIASSLYVTHNIASGATGKALAILNQTEDQDLLTASASGATRFAISNNGNIRMLESTGGTYFGTLAVGDLTNNVTYTLPMPGSGTTPTICLDTGNCAGSGGGITGSGTATQLAFFTGSGSIGSDASLFWDNTNKLLGIGTSTPLTSLHVNGLNSQGRAAFIVDQTASSSNNIIAASSSGTTKFVVNNNGNLGFAGSTSVINTLTSTATVGRTYTFPDLDGVVCLSTSSGCIPGATNYWQQNVGAISPYSSTLDVLFGGTATDSAKFAFLNVNNGTPTASVSSGLNGNNGIYMTAAGTLATTNKLNLTLGGADTGAIVLNGFGAGVIQSNASGALSSAALNLAGGASYVSGILPLANGGTGLNINGTTIADGQILIGNNASDGFTLANLTAGAGIQITNGGGSITIAQTGSGASKWTEGDGGSVLFPNYASVADVLFGGTATSSAKFAFINNLTGTPTASISANSGNVAFYMDGLGNLGTTNKQNLTLGTSSTGGIVLNGFGTGIIKSDANGLLSANATINIGTETTGTLAVGRGGTGVTTFGGVNTLLYTTAADTLASLSTANNGVLVTDGSGVPSISSTLPNAVQGNITTLGTITTGVWNGTAIGSQYGGTGQNFASSTGVPSLSSGTWSVNATLSTALGGLGANVTAVGAGELLYSTGTTTYDSLAAGTAGYVLSSGGASAPSWINPESSSFGLWNLSNGTYQPKFASIVDLLIGGTATSSAKFAVLNVNNGTPVASVSSGLNGDSLFLTAAGNIATQNMNTLTLGGTTTGEIVLSPRNSIAGSYIVPGANNTVDLGLSGTAFRNIYAGTNIYVNGSAVCTANGNNCPAGATTYWDQFEGAIRPKYASVADLLLGGSSTASAKFAFINNTGSGTPTASISAQGSTANSTYLSATGTLATTNKQSLTLGSTTTGNLLFAPGGTTRMTVDSGGNVGIGNTAPQSLFAINTPVTADVGTAALIAATSAGTKGLVVQGYTSQSSDLQQWQDSNGNALLKVQSSGLLTALDSTSIASYANSGGTGDRSASGTVAPDVSTNKSTWSGSGINNILNGNQNDDAVQFWSNLADGDNTNKYIRFDFFTPKVVTESTWYMKGLSSNYDHGTWKWQGSNSTGGPWTDIGGNFTLSSQGSGTVTQVMTQLSGNTNAYQYYQIIGVSGYFDNGAGCCGNFFREVEFKLADPGSNGNTNIAGGFIGIGTDTLTHKLNVSGSKVGKALSMFNETGGNDIIVASQGGTTKFVVANNGNLQFAGSTAYLNTLTSAATAARTYTFPDASGTICLSSNNCAANSIWNTGSGSIFQGNVTQDLLLGGTSTSSAKFAFLNVNNGTPTASVSSGLNGNNGIYMTAAGTLATTNKLNLTLGGADTGAIVLNGFGAGVIQSNASGALSSAALNLAGGSNYVTGILPVLNGGTGVNASGVLDGQILIGNDAANGFSLATLTAGSGINISNSAGGITISQTGSGASKWTETLGGSVLFPNYASVADVLIGGTSTASAKFAFLNVNNGTPVASVSSGLNGNNGIYLTASGSLATTNMSNLTLGSSSTGNVLLAPGGTTALAALTSGNIGIGNTTPNAALHLTGRQIIGPADTTFNGSETLKIAGGTNNDTWINISGSSDGVAVDDVRWVMGQLDAQAFIGTATNHNFEVRSNNVGRMTVTSDGLISMGFSSPTTQLHVSRDMNYGATGKALAIFDQLENQDIFTASASGTTRFTIANDGEMRLYDSDATNYTSFKAPALGTNIAYTLPSSISDGYILTTNGSGTLSWLDPGTLPSSNYWDQLNSGSALTPKYASVADLLLGGTSTSSAKFAVLNINNGTPVASVSSGLNGNNGIYITATGTLATTNKINLTLGGADTGAIVLNGFGAGVIQSNASGALSSAALNLAGGSSYVTGVLPIANGGTNKNLTLSNGGIIWSDADSFEVLNAGTAGQALLSGGAGTPTWADTNTSAFGLWDQLSGALRPKNTTVDFLLGGTATSSAKFGVLNLDSGTPTATIAGNMIVMPWTNGSNQVGGSLGIGTTAPTALAQVVSTSVLPSNGIGYFDWSPSSSTTSTNDLFTLNLGTNGNLGKIFNIKDGGSSVFSVSETAVETSLPVNFTSPGDVAIAYDLNFTNPTASYINSDASLYLRAGKVFNSDDLTLQTYNNGSVVLDTSLVQATGGMTINGQYGGNALFSLNQTASQDIFTASASGTTRFVINNAGNVGIGITSPQGKLNVEGLAVGKALGILNETGNQNILVGSASGSTRFVFDRNGGLTLGLASSTQGSLVLANTSANSVTIASSNSTSGAYTFTLPVSGGSNGYILTTNGSGVTSWLDPGTLPSSNYWDQLNSGSALTPKFASVADLLLGGTSTSSAKFAVLNMNAGASGTPTASVSGGVNGNGLYLTAAGNIATTNLQNLTLGDASTGSINLTPGANRNINFTMSGAGDFAVNSNDLYVDTSTGNVGIGTTSPGQQLEISGNLAFTSGANRTIGFNGSAGNNLTISSGTGSSQAGGNLNLYAGDGGEGLNGGNIYLYPGNGSSGGVVGNILLGHDGVTPRGNVGIGKTSPNATLDILGTATISAALTVSGGSIQTDFNTALIIGGNKTGEIILSPRNSVAGSYVGPGAANNVDLGTSTVAWRNLYVNNIFAANGDGVSGFFQRNNGALSPIQNTNDLLLGSTATNSAKFGFLNVAGGTPTASISANSGNNAVYIDGSGKLATTNKQNLTLGDSTTTGNIILNPSGNIGVGTTTPGNGLVEISGNTTNAKTTSLYISQNATIPSAGSNYGLRLNNNTNVGTMTGDDKLSYGIYNELNPTVEIRGASTYGAFGQLNIIDTTNLTFGTSLSSGNVYDLVSSQNTIAGTPTWNSTISNNIISSIGVNSLTSISLTATSVGASSNYYTYGGNFINTSSSTGHSDLTSIAYGINASATGNLTTTGTTTHYAGRFTASGTADTNYGLFVESSGATNNYAAIFASGNVGIGTSTPARKLVISDSGSGNVDMLFQNGTTGGTNTDGFYVGIDANEAPSLWNYENTEFTIGTNATERFRISADGNIGIGTTNPTNLLDIAGTTTPSLLNVSGSSIGKALAILNQTGDQAIFTASSAGTTRFVIANDGNVGIGVTNPGSKLDVAGSGAVSTGTSLVNLSSTYSIAGNYTGASRSLYNQSLSFTPGATPNSNASFTAAGINNAVALGNLTLGDTTTGDNTITVNSGNFTISGNPTFNDLAANNNNNLNVTGVNADVTSTLSITNPSNEVYANYYGGKFNTTIASTGSVGGAVTQNVYGVYGTAGGNLALTGSPAHSYHYGGYFDATGTAEINYGLRVSASGATNNYGVYIDNVNTGLSLYSSGTAASAFRGALRVGEGATTGGLFETTGSSIGKALAVLNQTGDQDIFTASASGTTRFTIANDGEMRLYDSDATNYTSFKAPALGTNIAYTLPSSISDGYILTTNGSGTLSWLDPGTLPSSNYWDQLNSGSALTPKYASVADLLLGGTSTSSAKFAVLNMNAGASGTPTASISGGVNGNGLYLTAAGNIATTNLQNLTLGDASTGSINLTPGANRNINFTMSGAGDFAVNSNDLYVDTSTGNVGIGTTAPASHLQIAGANATLSVSPSSGEAFINMGAVGAESQYQFARSASGDFVWDTNGASYQFFINDGGNVGIGTGGYGSDSSADYTLELFSAATSSTLGISDSDIAHGVTGIANTDTWFNVAPISSTDGGAYINAFSDAVGAKPFELRGIFGSTDPTDTVAALSLSGARRTGTTTTTLDKAETVLQVNNNTTPLMTMLGSGALGLGTTTPLSVLHVSDGQIGGRALAIFDQIGAVNNDIFTASAGGVTKFTLANNGNITATSSATTFNGFSFAANNLTTGNGLNLTTTNASMTSGNLLSVNSTANFTGFTGSLGYFDWSPTSSTTGTGDLFTLNLGSNGNLGKIFNIKDGGSSVFSVSETAVETSLPVNFTSPGDVAIAYDLNFTNPTASYINSSAPLYIRSGEVFNSSDLNLQTYNNGNVVIDSALTSLTTGGLKVNGQYGGSALFQLNQTASNQDIFTASAAGTTRFVINNSGNVGIGTTTPLYKLHAVETSANGAAVVGVNSATSGTNYASSFAATGSGPTTNIGGFFTASGATNNYAGIFELGNVGIGTTTPRAKLQVDGGNSPVASISARSVFAGLVIDNTGGTGSAGDIFTASASGMTRLSLTNGGALRLFDGDASNYSGFKANLTTTSNSVYTLPAAFPAGNGYVMTSQTDGSLAWLDPGLLPSSWQEFNSGSHLAPRYASVTDLLLGGTSTSSAKISFTNMLTGNPTLTVKDSTATKSISLYHDGTNANLSVSSGNLVLGSAGSLYVEADLLNDTSANGGFVKIADRLNVEKAENAGNALAIFNQTGTGEIFTASSSGTTRFVIQENGNVGIGTRTPGAALNVVADAADYAAEFFNDGNNANRLGLLVQAGTDDGSGTNTLIQFLDGDGTDVGEITYTGTTTTYGTTSDRRAKEDIVNTLKGLDQLMQIQVRDYKFINDPNQQMHTGFIAQELVEIVPEAVSIPNDPTKMWSVDYGKLTPLLVKSVQQQQEQINTLQLMSGQSGVASLSALVQTMDTTVDSLGNAVSNLDSSVAGLNTSVTGLNSSVTEVATVAASTSATLNQTQQSVLSLQSSVTGMDGLFANLNSRVDQLASASAFMQQALDQVLMTSSQSASLTQTLANLSVETATVSGDLMVLGRTTVSDLGVTGNITAGVMSINGLDSEINTIGEPLKLQAHGLYGIEMVGGKVTVATNGDITTEGKVVAEKIETKKVIISSDPVASGSAVLNSSVGVATIPAGSVSIDVKTSALTPNSLIFTTPDQAVAVGTKKINSNTFRMTIEEDLPANLKINWWIVDNKQLTSGGQ